MSVRKTPNIQKLVVSAIRKLQDVEGSTPREISNYISQEYDVPSTKIQRQVRLALARAASYGILHKSKGGYYACNRDFGFGLRPQMEEPQLTERCVAGRGRGHRAKRARSRKSRRRKSAAGSKRRRRSRRSRTGRSRRRRSSRRGRRRGASSRGRKSRRRRGGRHGACKPARRSRRRSRHSRRRRSRRGRGGKMCGPDATGEGAEEFDVLTRGTGRGRAGSSTGRAKRSVSTESFEDERLEDKQAQNRIIDAPETLLD